MAGGGKAAGLTARAVEAARAGAAHRDLSDGRGLVLRVHPSGRKVWLVRATARRTGERMRRELGEYGDGPGRLTLAQARARAAEWRGLIEAGTDPAKPRGAMTVAEAIEGWLKDAGLRSEAMVRRRAELHILPKLGKRAVADLEQREVAAMLRHLRHGEKKLTAEANRVRTTLATAWNWARAQGEIGHGINPVLGTNKVPERSQEREKAEAVRVLTLDELATIWRAARADPSPIVSVLLPLLILVPLRREEWTRSRWEEIEVDASGRWTLRIPASRMKGGRPHAVPLPQAAVALLGERGGEGFIFSATGGRTSFAGWKRAAARIAEAAALSERWVVHDIRRGAATAMGDAGIRETTIKRILAHSPRGFMGVTRTYERSERHDEVRAALGRWAEIIGSAVEPKPNVVPMARAAS